MDYWENGTQCTHVAVFIYDFTVTPLVYKYTAVRVGRGQHDNIIL